MTLSAVIGALACPVCGEPLAIRGRALSCGRGHAFDVAREGHVNLTTAASNVSTADTPAMVAARRRALASGCLDPVIEGVARMAADSVDTAVPGIVVDAGGGTGEYLAAVLARMPGRAGLLADASKHAAKAAARAVPAAGVVVADVWSGLPVASAAAAVVLDVFAPRNVPEFARILAPGGALVVVTPLPEHLGELREPLGMLAVDPDKEHRLSEQLAGRFTLEAAETVVRDCSLSRAEAADLALMGPAGAHHDPGDFERLAGALPEPVHARVAVRIARYRRVDAPS